MSNHAELCGALGHAGYCAVEEYWRDNITRIGLTRWIRRKKVDDTWQSADRSLGISIKDILFWRHLHPRFTTTTLGVYFGPNRDISAAVVSALSACYETRPPKFVT